ncbi:hypothetical protein F5X96DRAFT_496243 [Biscogniauxia mediterranea]|nr:hypothetical protein F5X96DRAFT_496243 [Biscogniauxia mediterranea]
MDLCRGPVAGTPGKTAILGGGGGGRIAGQSLVRRLTASRPGRGLSIRGGMLFYRELQVSVEVVACEVEPGPDPYGTPDSVKLQVKGSYMHGIIEYHAQQSYNAVGKLFRVKLAGEHFKMTADCALSMDTKDQVADGTDVMLLANKPDVNEKVDDEPGIMVALVNVGVDTGCDVKYKRIGFTAFNGKKPEVLRDLREVRVIDLIYIAAL